MGRQRPAKSYSPVFKLNSQRKRIPVDAVHFNEGMPKYATFYANNLHAHHGALMILIIIGWMLSEELLNIREQINWQLFIMVGLKFT